ncbi:hypothetical protein ACJJTC_006197 [Scirpophaga incertulas]
MSQAKEDKIYTVQPVSDGDVDEIMNLLRRTFYVDEPLNDAIELYSEDTPCPELDEYCRHSLLEGLSFKAVSKQGRIVGVTISGVSPLHDRNGTDMLKQAEQCKNPKFQKILYILTQREEGARLWERYPDEKEMVEVHVAATDENWRKLGIMNKLMEETENATKKRGFHLLRLDTSSFYSAKSAERLGFTCVHRALYKDITKDGQPLIVPKPPHIEDRVNIKVLTT